MGCQISPVLSPLLAAGTNFLFPARSCRRVLRDGAQIVDITGILDDKAGRVFGRSLKTSIIPGTYAGRMAKLFPCRPTFVDAEPPESNDGWRNWH